MKEEMVEEDKSEHKRTKDADFPIDCAWHKQNDVDPLFSSPRGLGTTVCRICFRSIENLKQI